MKPIALKVDCNPATCSPCILPFHLGHPERTACSFLALALPPAKCADKANKVSHPLSCMMASRYLSSSLAPAPRPRPHLPSSRPCVLRPSLTSGTVPPPACSC